MLGLISLHQLAAARGDGLRPELLDLLARRQFVVSAAANVTDIAQHREYGMIQAGPNPVGRLGDAGVENVVPFGHPEATPAPNRLPARSRQG